MLPRLVIVLICIACAGTAHAGAWLREKGAGFSSFSFSSSYSLDTVSQTYLEYGLTEKTTLGADIGFVRPRFGLHGGYMTLFMRRAVGSTDLNSKWAYDLGVGASWTGDSALPHLRTGLSWGRGIAAVGKSGWVAVDAAVIWDLTYARHLTKVDTTIGLNFTDTTAGMVQLFAGNLDQKTFRTFAPSLIVSPKFTKFRIQFGTESEVGNLRNSVLKLGLWREF